MKFVLQTPAVVPVSQVKLGILVHHAAKPALELGMVTLFVSEDDAVVFWFKTGITMAHETRELRPVPTGSILIITQE